MNDAIRTADYSRKSHACNELTTAPKPHRATGQGPLNERQSSGTVAGDATRTGNQSTGRLLGAGDVRRIASLIAMRPSKRFGQNFVVDPGTVRRIVRIARIGPGSQVLEVGPGLGSLSLAILESGAQVSAVEIDSSLATRLPETVREFMPEALSRLKVLNKDAMRLEPVDLPDAGFSEESQPLTMVANLPYNVATPIVLTLLEKVNKLDRFLVMVQKEVADRLVAQPGTKVYGAPSAKLAWYGRSEQAGSIGRNVFWPTPNVDSALVSFSRYRILPSTQTWQSSMQDNETLRKETFHLIDTTFGQRRKTLRSTLRGQLSMSDFDQAGIDPARRGETLSIEEFIALARVSHGVGHD